MYKWARGMDGLVVCTIGWHRQCRRFEPSCRQHVHGRPSARSPPPPPSTARSTTGTAACGRCASSSFFIFAGLPPSPPPPLPDKSPPLPLAAVRSGTCSVSRSQQLRLFHFGRGAMRAAGIEPAPSRHKTGDSTTDMAPTKGQHAHTRAQGCHKATTTSHQQVCRACRCRYQFRQVRSMNTYPICLSCRCGATDRSIHLPPHRPYPRLYWGDPLTPCMDRRFAQS